MTAAVEDLSGAAPILVGLIGRGIGSSRSPRLHQAEGAAQGRRIAYKLFDFDTLGWADERLPDLLRALATAGFAGTNVTFPFKQAVIPHLDALTPGARAIGAVNTVVFRDGRSTGHNTDATGFAAGIEAHVAAGARRHVLQLGAGGAGSATAWAMLDLGVERLTIADTDAERRDQLVADLRARFGERVAGSEKLGEVAPCASGIVNATPIGMAKLPGTPIDPALLAHRPWVYDIIYFPLETELLRDAAALGCQTINGVTMVVHQGAAAFALFNDLAPDIDRMTRSLFEPGR
ncbi:shikimate dehydrogenase [Sphingomonas donggukensis]|uniref:Shikimate dehydrogenase (NADP(+)) n=1 Tax=Sphingomonas donggukensis TaxID=2949093 RepID=A0ABY4TRT7_9SPHN|nr:shikimate dehydrogenase [Sphingomonas donggukensis]URW75095.1 shikimate dehydrogenase [Sphingomonas donggukensis]